MGTRDKQLARAFVELADTMVENFDVLDFLQRLAVHSAELFQADTAAIVLLDQRDVLQVVATTSHAAADLELVASASRQGPCLDAVTSGSPVVNTPIDQARDRWPEFTAAFLRAGFRTVNVFPMRLRTETIGAVTVLGRSAWLVDDDDVEVATALASVATISLLQERSVRQQEVVAAQLQSALNDRVRLEQAKGVVAETLRVDVDDAFELLHAHARRTGGSLTLVVRELLDGTLHAGELSPLP